MADYISINGKESKYGIKLSGKADKVIEEIRKHTNEKGYINLEILKRKEPGKYGETHYVKVDTWEPPAREKGIPYKETEDAKANTAETTEEWLAKESPLVDKVQFYKREPIEKNKFDSDLPF